jgi:hypothetical protein
MTIKLRKEMFEHLLNGSKKSTSRFGLRDVKVGEELIFEMIEDNTMVHKTVVTDVIICKFSDLTEDEAKKEGYNSLKDLKEALVKIYNPVENDIFTLIHFA